MILIHQMKKLYNMQKLETGEGKKYYANPQTRQSSWTPPPGSTGGSTRLSITQVEKQLDL